MSRLQEMGRRACGIYICEWYVGVEWMNTDMQRYMTFEHRKKRSATGGLDLVR